MSILAALEAEELVSFGATDGIRGSNSSLLSSKRSGDSPNSILGSRVVWLFTVPSEAVTRLELVDVGPGDLEIICP